jgi:hypothetical protein
MILLKTLQPSSHVNRSPAWGMFGEYPARTHAPQVPSSEKYPPRPLGVEGITVTCTSHQGAYVTFVGQRGEVWAEISPCQNPYSRLTLDWSPRRARLFHRVVRCSLHLSPGMLAFRSLLRHPANHCVRAGFSDRFLFSSWSWAEVCTWYVELASLGRPCAFPQSGRAPRAVPARLASFAF